MLHQHWIASWIRKKWASSQLLTTISSALHKKPEQVPHTKKNYGKKVRLHATGGIFYLPLVITKVWFQWGTSSPSLLRVAFDVFV